MANYKFGINEPPHKRWPVAWYNPAVLFRSAVEMISTGNQLRNLDKRELFQKEFEIIDLSKNDLDAEFWWDFMSDSGDGGNASYTIARAMQEHHLKIEDGDIAVDITPSQRGELLVLGGDLAYPGASNEEYQYRFIEMWEASKSTGDQKRKVLAIPQNHDWFDNISTFNRHFIGEFDRQFLDADTPQTRSYFAARLPQNWWILGLDFALVGDLDREQLDIFLKLIEEDLTPEDNVILLYPEPYWTRSLGDNARPGYPKRYQRFEDALHEKGVRVRMHLAGDLHHYSRATATSGASLDYDDMLITCGSGGAFLHPTHAIRAWKEKVLDRSPETGAITPDLQKRARVGIQDEKKKENQRAYQYSKSYPGILKSWGLSWTNLWALFKPTSFTGIYSSTSTEQGWKSIIAQRLKETWDWAFSGNIMLPISLGILYWLAVLCNSFVFSDAFAKNGFKTTAEIPTLELQVFLLQWFKAFFFSPLALTVHLIIFLVCFCIAFEDGKKSAIPGAVHGGLQVLAVPTLYWWVGRFLVNHESIQILNHSINNDYVKGALLVGSGIVVSGLLFGIFFSVMSACGLLTNNAFSTLAHQGYKGFLRFRIDKHGNLHAYMIGTDDIPREWKINSSGKHPLWVEKNSEEAPIWKVRDAFTLKK